MRVGSSHLGGMLDAGERPTSMTAGNFGGSWRFERALLGALVAILLAGQAYLFHDLRHDDPFISYRYGQNLANGYGLTFNPGERFLGATSPGHMLLAALVHALVGRDATPSVMSALGCVGWTAQAVAVFFLLRSVVGPLGALLTAVAVELGAACSFMWVPFEANLVAALSLWALVGAQRRHWLAAAVLAALACLMRPDALLLAAVLGAACVWERRSQAYLPTCVFAGLTLPWVAFAWAYYGNPLPHSAVEKFQRTELRPYFEHALRLLGETLFPFARSIAWLVIAWLWIGAGAWFLAKRERGMRMLVLYALLHLGAYLVLRPFSGHDWHLYPFNLLAVVIAAGALCAFTSHGSVAVRWAATLALGAWVMLVALRTADGARTYRNGHWTGARDGAYRNVARYLTEHAQPGDHFACVEVGTLAYYSDLPAYDLGGLITDLRHVNMSDRPVRWLVLDKKYLSHAPPWPPVFRTAVDDFEAFVFYLPKVPIANR